MTSEFQKAQQSAAIRDRKRTGGARKISGPFNAYLVEMKRSPAWQVLNMPERRMLERLEEEHNKHGATKNGELIVTYKDFIAARISRKKIKPSQRTIVALGFVEITEQGYGGGKHADDRRPTKFRLTYFRAHDAEGDGTHEWRGITTVEEAVAVATAARHEKPGAPKGHKNSISVPHGGTETADSPVPQKATFQYPGGARLYRDRLGSQPERGAGPHDQACNIGQLRNDILVALTATYGCAASQAFQALKFFENSVIGQPSLPRQPLSSVPNAAARNGAKLATPTSSVTPPLPPADVPAPSIATITPEASTLTPVAGEAVSPEWDACLQLAAEWGGINLDRAVETVTAMVGKLSIEGVQHHFSKVAKLHRSGGNKLELVERAIAKEFADLHPAQGDLFAPSPGVLALGATSPPAGAAPPPPALVFDLAALREYAGQIAAWQPQLDAATAQRVAREWMAAAGVKRLRPLFAKVGPRKRSGAFKFDWIKDRVDNPRPQRPARRQAQGSSA
jgi:hypothetical protein